MTLRKVLVYADELYITFALLGKIPIPTWSTQSTTPSVLYMFRVLDRFMDTPRQVIQTPLLIHMNEVEKKLSREGTLLRWRGPFTELDIHKRLLNRVPVSR